MKRLHIYQRIQHSPIGPNLLGAIAALGANGYKPKRSLSFFLGLCFNGVLAPAVLAASGGDFDRSQVYWLVALGLVTIAISIYLFVVMFVPEKF